MAPSLADFGHDLASGEWYVLKGAVERNFGGTTEWRFNPLMAARSGQLELAFAPRPLMITGSGALKSVKSVVDSERRVIDSCLPVDVTVIVKPHDMPGEMSESFFPGTKVVFSGVHVGGTGEGGLVAEL
ncbi:hypothetical protein PtA15_13A369 [Puccinia triticina]|uniref:Uncharacterized protein n=1 Tax=Puccinia triticina TaxID=208348 RepID=A0ABY7D296_9BASI|nr:uncharacterized protein PtA15_13A369 [Puccinia triticina]WAQ90969.1 hypothetical protein PtA15_13A369 [Puccinia triticina]WAR61157.1 hypothetical protein PtB15_13B409 [Puccinia triticina]